MNNQVKIQIPTNYNGKLSCNCFIHIDEAPRQGVPESKLKNTIVQIETADKSHPPVKAMVKDLIRIQLGAITTAISWSSHGMEWHQFIERKIAENPELHYYSPMAVYFYQKV